MKNNSNDPQSPIQSKSLTLIKIKMSYKLQFLLKNPSSYIFSFTPNQSLTVSASVSGSFVIGIGIGGLNSMPCHATPYIHIRSFRLIGGSESPEGRKSTELRLNL